MTITMVMVMVMVMVTVMMMMMIIVMVMVMSWNCLLWRFVISFFGAELSLNLISTG